MTKEQFMALQELNQLLQKTETASNNFNKAIFTVFIYKSGIKSFVDLYPVEAYQSANEYTSLDKNFIEIFANKKNEYEALTTWCDECEATMASLLTRINEAFEEVIKMPNSSLKKQLCDEIYNCLQEIITLSNKTFEESTTILKENLEIEKKLIF